MISLAYYVRTQLPRDRTVLHRFEPTNEFLSWPLEQQIDWYIERAFSAYGEWIGNWTCAIDRGVLNGIVLSFEELVANECIFFRRILEFLGIDPDRFKIPGLPLDQSTNFRLGRVDEWRDVFTRAQKARTAELLPAALRNRFGWPAE